ncbi:Lrp/AsnC family transcriptional regulator [Spiractinospora alimapuensis]|uniref:Lrp/AsnC family transcriptional regulator n=1 Tax=Spiractinospora alimapuensis TaxID=2820884 RepID=UPI001F2FEB1E|nr:Lrp/AsnC family transcriptional regulator [Spiractinospora alimapuensis]QVQ51505.1 Lrp/AsnC family transcriptional regulator [Spiractinospora alimapuensis]
MSAAIELDSVDLALLAELQNDARISNKDLAARVGVAPSTCLARVQRLRQRGVIHGFRVVLDEKALGNTVEAFLAIQMTPHNQAFVPPFIEETLRRPGVREIFLLTGPDDFMVRVSVQDLNALQRLVLEHFTTRREIAAVQTRLIFQSWAGGPIGPT